MRQLLTLLLMIGTGAAVVAQTDTRARGSQTGTVQTGARTVSGTVTDAAGEALTGASVSIVNKANGSVIGGTYTDGSGNFQVSVPTDGAYVLRVSYLGSKTYEIGVESASSYKIILQSEDTQVSEVVITALGIQRNKRETGYALSSVGGADLAQARRSNPTDALAGRVAGVTVTKSSGGVNSSTRVVVRGTKSMQGDNQPLYVIDGVPMFNDNIMNSGNQVNQVDTGNRIGDINPDDIETMTVLKGPAAAALYGGRAGGGAIIITTKSGKNRRKKTEVTYTGGVTFESPLKLPDLQFDYATGYSGLYDPGENYSYGPRFDGLPINIGPQLPDGTYQRITNSGKPNTIRDFFETGVSFSNTLQLASGNDNGSFLLSVGDVNQDGIIYKDMFRRTSFRLNGSYKFSNRLSATGSFQYNRNYMNTSYQGASNSVDGPAPYAAALNSSFALYLPDYKDLNGKYANNRGWYGKYYENPYAMIEYNRFQSSVDRFIVSAAVSYDPFEWMNITGRLGIDTYTDLRKQTFDKQEYSVDPYEDGDTRHMSNYAGSMTDLIYTRSQINFTGLVNVNRRITEDFKVRGVIGFEINQRTTGSQSQRATALAIPGLFNINYRVGEAIVNQDYTRRRFWSMFADMTLDWRNMVFLHASVRNDNSSTLPVGKNSYYYPAIDVSAVFTELLGIESNGILNYGKIRLAYAQSGLDTDPYALAPTLGVSTGFPFGSIPGYTVSDALNNPNLRPEQNNSYEIGTELSFLNDRIFLDLTYYYSYTRDLLTRVATPPSTGYISKLENAGEISNRGWEILLRGYPVKTENFTWELGFNFTTNQSRVEKLYSGLNQLVIGPAGYTNAYIVGQPAPVLYGTVFLRDPQGRVVVGANGIPRRNPVSQSLGQTAPKWTLGITNSFSYKNWSLSAVLDIRRGAKFWSGTRAELLATGKGAETIRYNREPFIYPNSVIETAPGVYAENTSVFTPPSDDRFWSNDAYRGTTEASLVSADFIKLREVALSYRLPANWLEGTPFGEISVSFLANNVLMFLPSENIFVDPEANIMGASNNAQGYELNSIPSTRAFGGSVTIKF